VQDAAADPRILGVALISAADLGGRIPQLLQQRHEQAAIKVLNAAYDREGMAPLSGCTSQGLARETLVHAAQWSFASKASALSSRPALIVSSDDAYARQNQAFAAALRRAGDRRVTSVHLDTDHVYSDQRGALSKVILRWLATVGSPAQR
jgi:hypothetical protein